LAERERERRVDVIGGERRVDVIGGVITKQNSASIIVTNMTD